MESAFWKNVAELFLAEQEAQSPHLKRKVLKERVDKRQGLRKLPVVCGAISFTSSSL